jgi:hypothetical protein
VVSGREREMGQIPNKVSQILPQPAPIRATMLGGAAFSGTRPAPSGRPCWSITGRLPCEYPRSGCGTAATLRRGRKKPAKIGGLPNVSVAH